MTHARRLAFVIHSLHQRGGMERCTLEVARRLSLRWPVDIHAFSFEPGPKDGWGDVAFHPVRPHVRRPVLLRSQAFHLATAASLRDARRRKPPTVVHAAGACSFESQIVQLHYVHAAWDAARRAFPERLEPARLSNDGASHLRSAYRHAVTAYARWSERVCFTSGRTYVAVSRRIADELKEHYRIEHDVHVIHHAVDAERFTPCSASTQQQRTELRRSYGFGPDDVVLLMVGALERKGLPVVMDAVAALPRRERARVRVLAVGQGDHRALRERARRLGIEAQVRLAPPTPRISEVYRSADVFAFPTLYEPFGLVVLEAMASGLPTVVSARAGAAEVVTPDSGIVLDDPTDAHTLARALEPLVADKNFRRRMGEAARAQAVRRTWDDVAEEYARVLTPWMA